MLLLTILCVIVAGWLVEDALRAARAPRLGLADAAIVDDEAPLVSVLIPARDEEGRIGGCLEGLAQQAYRNFEVIVVDDGSADATGDVARGYASRLPALSVLRGAQLPAGWSGKCWACSQAAGRARGEWLLFLDADVRPGPGLIAALVGRARAARLDMLTLLPLLVLGSNVERAALPAFFQLVASIYPLGEVNDPRSPIAFAIGQCILVRREVYHAVGGHAAVRGSILEDMELARLVKGSGHRLLAAEAPDLVSVRMYDGWPALRDGLGKNAVAGYRNAGLRSGAAGLRQGLAALLPLDLLVAGAALLAARPGDPRSRGVALRGALLAALALACWGYIMRRRFRIGARWGALFPVGTLLYYGLAARALVMLRAGRGVTWKGRVFTR